MAVQARVRDLRTGSERLVMPKAYSLIPKRYELLGYEDENGNPVDFPAKVVRAQKKSAAPAVVSERTRMTPEEIAAKRAEFEQMNDDAREKARLEAVEKGEKRKPGRPSKTAKA